MGSDFQNFAPISYLTKKNGGKFEMSEVIDTKRNFQTTQHFHFLIEIKILPEEVVDLPNKTVYLCLIFVSSRFICIRIAFTKHFDISDRLKIVRLCANRKIRVCGCLHCVLLFVRTGGQTKVVK